MNLYLYEIRKHIFFLWYFQSLDLINVKIFRMFKIFKILTALVKSIIMKDLLSASVALLCSANQLTGVYMRATLALNGLIKITLITFARDYK